MNSKTKFTLTVTAMVAVTLLAIVGIMAVFAARQQSFSTSITVVYKSTNVEGTASAQWRLGSYWGSEGYFFRSDHWHNMDDNGAEDGGNTELDLSANGALTLSPQETIALSDTYPTVVFKYSITNTANHPFTLNFNYQSSTETKNINSFYTASSQELDDNSLSNINKHFTNTLETTVLGGTIENIYILLEIDDLGIDSMFDGTFNIELNGLPSDYNEDYTYLFDGTNATLKEVIDKETTIFDASTLLYKGAHVTAIGDGAFQNNTNLQTLKLEGIKEIGQHAFDGCSSLTDLTIVEDISYIANEAFSNLVNLTNLNFKAINVSIANNGKGVFWKGGRQGAGIDVVFGDNVEQIPNYLFNTNNYGMEDDKPKIKSVKIGKSVATIGESLFGDKNTVVSFQVDQVNEKFTSRDNVGRECNALIDKTTKTLIYGFPTTTIPDDESVKAIGRYALAYCSVDSLTIPQCIEHIEAYAFYGTSTSIINYYAENVADEIEGGFTTNIFGPVSTDVTVTIGENVKHISSWFFAPCYNVYLKITTAIINSADAYKELTGTGGEIAGDLLGAVESCNGTLKVKTDIVEGNDMPEYLQTNYTKSDSAVDGYYTFTKIASD